MKPTFLLILCVGISCGAKYKIPDSAAERGTDFWFARGREELDESLEKKIHKTVAKNVIVFVGGGMGVTVTTAARIYKGQKKGNSGEEEKLIWDDFPNMALMKSYSLDKQVPDTAASATAFFTGVKSNSGTIGVSGRVDRGNCSAAREEANVLHSVLGWFQDAGKDTGLVTTTRITHATPAALYAHSADRNWECDPVLKGRERAGSCKDIGKQLIEDSPGKDLNVILGGGRFAMGAKAKGDQQEDSCSRSDSVNLVDKWKADKKSRSASAAYITNNEDLRRLKINTEFILGLFGSNHMSYDFNRDTSLDGGPSLKEMTELAIKRLQQNNKGFFLVVDGGRIDHALQATMPRAAFEEVLAMEAAVVSALRMTEEEDTLIIVTGDHSHVMTINGYPDRGNDILGTTGDNTVAADGLPFTTLMFTNGLGANYTYTTAYGGKVQRADLTKVDTRDFYFHPQAAVPTNSSTNAGEDVAIYAVGSYAHLFHRVHEQSFLAHAMGFAACVGPYKIEKHCKGPSTIERLNPLKPFRG